MSDAILHNYAYQVSLTGFMQASLFLPRSCTIFAFGEIDFEAGKAWAVHNVSQVDTVAPTQMIKAVLALVLAAGLLADN